MKVHVKRGRGKNAPLKLTMFLPEDVVLKVWPQIKRFVAAVKKRKKEQEKTGVK